MFENRTEAGILLAKAVMDREEGVFHSVLGVPRGGIVVAAPVANALGASLAPVHAIKIRAPQNPELAIGAVANGIDPVLDSAWAMRLGRTDLQSCLETAMQELRARQRKYGQTSDIAGQRVVMVDDGAATGYTTMAAARSIRASGAKCLVVAVPVASPEAAAALQEEADVLVTLGIPKAFMAVGQFYRSFEPVSDEEVLRLLSAAS